jgi:predicted PurR-regulated permease PerM
MTRLDLPQHAFLLLLGIVSLAFGWLLLPFFGAVFWGVVLAIVFAPLHRWLLGALGNRPNCAALAAVLLIVVMVLVPATLLAASLIDQTLALYRTFSAVPIDVNAAFERTMARLPHWLTAFLERHEAAITDTLQEKFGTWVAQVGQTAARHAIGLGRSAFDVVVAATVMLYLLFFLFRDGRPLAARIRHAIPLSPRYKTPLFDKLVTVTRATVKGNLLVAMAQGALGGLIFWFLDVPAPVLWGVVMTFLSLLPAVGAAIVWGPVAAWFLLDGAVWEGVLLALYGVLVIGLVDNLLRPVLVGKDTKLPDYLVLFSTIGGMALLGLNGFVIGPLIAALFVAAWSLFADADEFHER